MIPSPTDPNRLHTDRAKVRALVDEWLGDQPAIAKLLRGSIDRAKGWNIRADLEADGWVWVSLRASSGAVLAVWHGPRSYVEVDGSAVMQ